MSTFITTSSKATPCGPPKAQARTNVKLKGRRDTVPAWCWRGRDSHHRQSAWPCCFGGISACTTLALVLLMAAGAGGCVLLLTLRSASFDRAVRNCSKLILRAPLFFTCSTTQHNTQQRRPSTAEVQWLPSSTKMPYTWAPGCHSAAKTSAGDQGQACTQEQLAMLCQALQAV